MKDKYDEVQGQEDIAQWRYVVLLTSLQPSFSLDRSPEIYTTMEQNKKLGRF